MPEPPQSASQQISQPNNMTLPSYVLPIHLIIVINVDINVNNIINVINVVINVLNDIICIDVMHVYYMLP